MAPHTNLQLLDSPAQDLALTNLDNIDFDNIQFDLFNDDDLMLNDEFKMYQEDQDEQQQQQQQQGINTYTQIKQEPIDNSLSIQLSNNKRELRYGPVVVRPRKKPAPTLSSGRRSKNAVLTPEENIKREIRRQRNRVAAEKCKKKREEIETGLENTVKQLENKSNELMTNLNNLNKQKALLEQLLQQHNCRLYSQRINSNSNTNNTKYQSQYQQPHVFYQQQQQQQNMIFDII
jgi:hypothetical protein